MPVETGLAVVAAVAIIYGIGFAVLPMREWSDKARSAYTLGGAGLVGLLFLVLVVVPWFIRQS